MVGLSINGMPAMSITAIETTRRPRFSRSDRSPAFRLTERDIEIVRQVARHRLLRSTHVSQLLAAPHKKILERLTALYHACYLDRPRGQLEYHVHGGGSAPLVYALGKTGARLLSLREGMEDVDVEWTHKNRETGREFIQHTLAIADVRVALALACRAHGSVTLMQPDDLLPSLPLETRAARNPWAWRTNVQHDGELQDIGLQPDYVFALRLPDGRRRAFLVECDRGTMPVKRSSLGQSSMLRKFLAYESTRQRGLHTERFRWKNFRVLVVTANVERAANIRALIERTASLKDSPLFLFTDHTAITTSDILAYRWYNSSNRLHSLI
jgi:hypothetical protein